MSAGILPKPKRLRVGLALMSLKSWRAVLLEASILAVFQRVRARAEGPLNPAAMVPPLVCSVNRTNTGRPAAA